MLVYKGNEDPQQWAKTHFVGADMSDVRRVDRVVAIAEAMASNYGMSIPQMFESRYDIKATYNLFKHPEARPDNLQAGHREITLLEMEKAGIYLQLEDTTELSWAGNKPRKGLGPIGSSKDGKIGFHLHSVLAVRWPLEVQATAKRPPVEVIGLVDQQYLIRKPRPKGEARNSSYRRKKRERESQWWEQASERIGPAPKDENLLWIRVCDAGADNYEHLHKCRELGHSYIVRAGQDRCLEDPVTGEKAGHLFEVVRKSPAWGQFELELRTRDKEPARTARLSINATRVWLRVPHSPNRDKLSTIICNVVRVWEENPPQGVEPIEWILLTDLPVDNFEQAREIALIYSARWIIEEFHKALKSGLKAEDLQLETAEGLFAAIAIMSIVALRLLDLRERLRINPEAPAQESGLDELELEILRLKLQRPITTVREVALAIGRLGGHMNRRRDGMPGLITLWRGMLKLSALTEGARLARKLTKFG